MRVFHFLALLFCLVVAPAHSTNCGPTILNGGADHVATSGAEHRFAALRASADFAPYHEALAKFEAAYVKRSTMAEVFGKDKGAAVRMIDAKTEHILSELESGKLLPAQVLAAAGEVFGKTFSELGYETFLIEDDPGILGLWGSVAEMKNVKLARSDSTEAARFWLPYMNREKTHLLFDADIHDETLAGLALSNSAKDFGYTHISMVSGRSVLDLRDLGLDASIPNIQKPIMVPEMIKALVRSP